MKHCTAPHYTRVVCRSANVSLLSWVDTHDWRRRRTSL